MVKLLKDCSQQGLHLSVATRNNLSRALTHCPQLDQPSKKSLLSLVSHLQGGSSFTHPKPMAPHDENVNSLNVMAFTPMQMAQLKCDPFVPKQKKL